MPVHLHPIINEYALSQKQERRKGCTRRTIISSFYYFFVIYDFFFRLEKNIIIKHKIVAPKIHIGLGHPSNSPMPFIKNIPVNKQRIITISIIIFFITSLPNIEWIPNLQHNHK